VRDQMGPTRRDDEGADDTIARVAAALREPVRVDPALDARVMAEVWKAHALGRQAGRRGGWRAWLADAREWLLDPRTVSLSPLGAVALAAGVAALAVAGTLTLGARRPAAVAGGAAPAVDSGVKFASVGGAPSTTGTVQVVRFVLVAPNAASVSVVGDFNDWDPGATPLEAAPGNGVWTVMLPLPPGRYQYNFIVDGTKWVPDPVAPPAQDDFGTPNSVITVRESAT
jgi:hypothetical protein